MTCCGRRGCHFEAIINYGKIYGLVFSLLRPRTALSGIAKSTENSSIQSFRVRLDFLGAELTAEGILREGPYGEGRISRVVPRGDAASARGVPIGSAEEQMTRGESSELGMAKLDSEREEASRWEPWERFPGCVFGSCTKLFT